MCWQVLQLKANGLTYHSKDILLNWQVILQCDKMAIYFYARENNESKQ